MDWRFLDTGKADGATNMGLDEALLQGVARGDAPPTVRVYAWEPPTVSIGHSQRAGDELDLAAVARAGFGVVRRPTGGRAVLHAGELTYSVAGRAGEPPLGNTIMESYRAVALALVAGLGPLGVEADLAQLAASPRGRGGGASPPCFVSAGRFEIVAAGRKLVGSAQRRTGNAVLQHGSLLIDGTHARLVDVLRLDDEGRRSRLRRLLAAKTTDLETVLERPVAFDEVARAIRSGFEIAWGVELALGALTSAEIEASNRLATEYTV